REMQECPGPPKSAGPPFTGKIGRRLYRQKKKEPGAHRRIGMRTCGASRERRYRMSILTVSMRGTTLGYDTDRLTFFLEKDGTRWETERALFLTVADGTRICFTRAASITHRPWKTGLGEGFLTRFEGFPGVDVSFETLLW